MTDRNQLILEAVKLLANEGKCSNFKACKLLSVQMKHFQSVTIKRIRAGVRPCNSELEELMNEIFNLDDNPPLSAAYLDEIVIKLLKINRCL